MRLESRYYLGVESSEDLTGAGRPNSQMVHTAHMAVKSVLAVGRRPRFLGLFVGLLWNCRHCT